MILQRLTDNILHSLISVGKKTRLTKKGAGASPSAPPPK